ncbi:MAG: LamG domain-containing protein, partial [Nanoarchaeota archaeon]
GCGPATAVGTSNLSDENWHHVVGTFDRTLAANNIKIYVDGRIEAQTTYTAPITVDDNPIVIGALPSVERYFDGIIDEVRLWNKTLTEDEIKQHYLSNLYKYSNDAWNFITNITSIRNGTHTYMASSTDVSNSKNETDTRTITKLTMPQLNFTAPTPNNNIDSTHPHRLFNVSITNATELRNFYWNWNGTNYSFYNNTLVLMFNFDNVAAVGDKTASNRVADQSINKLEGEIKGAKYNTSGRYSSALSFDGTDDQVSITDPSAQTGSAIHDFENTTTWMAWIKYSKDKLQYITTKTNNIRLYTNANTGKAVFDINNGQKATGTSNLSDENWHHVVGTFDRTLASNNIKIYVDGKLEAQTTYTTSIIVDNTAIAIGAYPPGAAYFDGSIDEVRLWNKTLTEDEIKQHYLSNLYKYSND